MLTDNEKDALAQWMLSYDVELTLLKFDNPEDLETGEATMVWSDGLILTHNGKQYSVIPDTVNKTPDVMVLEWTPDGQSIRQSSWKPTWKELAQKAMTDYKDYDPFDDSPEIDNLLKKMNLI